MTKRNRISYRDRKAKGEEIGYSGVPISMGKVREDTLSCLRGPKKIKLLEEMVNFDPIVGAFNNMYLSIASSVKWSVKAKDDSQEAKDVADFISSCLFDDLSVSTFDEMVKNALTACTYGFSLIEPVYKIRNGKSNDIERNSKFDDGKIGIAKFSPRYQGSIHEWLYDDNYRNLRGIIQLDPNLSEFIEIPYKKLLHFKHRSFNNNPEGKSLYYNCVKSYVKKKNTSLQEDIRYERGFDGLLKINAPATILDPKTKNPQYLAVQSWIKDTLQNIRTGVDSGVAIPDYIKLDVISNNSGNLPDADKIIEREDRNMSVALLSDFFLTAQRAGTSGAVSSKIKLFTNLIKEMMTEIRNVINVNLIPNLMDKNLLNQELTPTIEFSEVAPDLDLTNLLLLLQSANKNQVVIPSAKLTNVVYKKILGNDAPEVTEEEFEKQQLIQKAQLHSYTTNRVSDEIVADISEEDNIDEELVEEANDTDTDNE